MRGKMPVFKHLNIIQCHEVIKLHESLSLRLIRDMSVYKIFLIKWRSFFSNIFIRLKSS